MALSENEKTSKEIMNLFTMPGGFKAGYVMIKHMEIQYENNSVNLLVGKYASEEARRENIDNCVNEFVGFPVTKSALQDMQNSDNRDVMYPYLEAQIRYLNDGEKTESVVQSIYDEYGIENPYIVAEEQTDEEIQKTV